MEAGGAGCCMQVIEKHASVRKFRGDPVPDGDLRVILEAARRAPSGWNLQPYTIVVVRDGERRREIADAVGGQEHVAEAPVFLVFMVDLAKVADAASRLGLEARPNLAALVEALVDVGIASAWAALAAESLGYGVVYVALYENPCGVADIVSAGKGTLPVIGLAIGRPAEEPRPRRRQRLEALVHEEAYRGARGDAILEVYGDRARRVFTYLYGPGGYYGEASLNLIRCLRRQGLGEALEEPLEARS